MRRRRGAVPKRPLPLYGKHTCTVPTATFLINFDPPATPIRCGACVGAHDFWVEQPQPGARGMERLPPGGAKGLERGSPTRMSVDLTNTMLAERIGYQPEYSMLAKQRRKLAGAMDSLWFESVVIVIVHPCEEACGVDERYGCGS